MKPFTHILLVIALLSARVLLCQTTVFKEKNHWGIKDKETIIVAPLYDTIFNFDEDNKVCLACFKLKSASANRIIKTSSHTWACNYLNRRLEKLRVKTEGNDTCTVFSLGKTTVKQYTESAQPFVVAVKGKKYMVNKDFRQLTFKGYHNVAPSLDPGFYHIQQVDESETVMAGLVDAAEKEIVPCHYSHVKINPVDSLIMCCTAGVRENSDDDIYDYSGKKITSCHRHLEMATKNFIIQKVFEPKEHLIIYNIKTREEKNLQANEVVFYEHDEILIRVKDDWYVYNLNTGTKKPKEY